MSNVLHQINAGGVTNGSNAVAGPCVGTNARTHSGGLLVPVGEKE